MTIDEPFVVETQAPYQAVIHIPYEVTTQDPITLYEIEEYVLDVEVP